MTIASYEAPADNAHNNIPGDLQALADWTEDQLNVLVSLLAQVAVPAGATMAWDDTAAPAGWHIRDGRAISRADNPVLFARYGVTQGAGNGSTTFNLPNDKGRALVGLDADQTEFDTIRKTGGAKKHRLTKAEIPDLAHSHPYNQETGTPIAYASGGNDALVISGTFQPQSGPPNTSLGGGGEHNNLQPYAVTNWIIKAG